MRFHVNAMPLHMPFAGYLHMYRGALSFETKSKSLIRTQRQIYDEIIEMSETSS